MNKEICPYDMDDVINILEDVRDVLKVVQWWFEDCEDAQRKRDQNMTTALLHDAKAYNSVLGSAVLLLRDLEDGVNAALEKGAAAHG